MYVATIPNLNSPPAILLRESYREGTKVKNRTLANLSHWPAHKVEALRAVLRGDSAPGALEQGFEIVRTLPHGHVVAVLGTLRRLDLHSIIAPKRCRPRDLCEAMIVGRLLEPGSKRVPFPRATDPLEQPSPCLWGNGRGGGRALRNHGLAARQAGANRSGARQAASRRRDPRALRRQLDLLRGTSLARIGHSRDGRFDRAQIVFGLLTHPEGCPVATEVFNGNTGAPKTVLAQVKKLREPFSLNRVVLAGTGE
jgi:hypothetical protein